MRERESWQADHHELNFLKKDLIGGFLNKDTLRFVNNVRSSFEKDEKRNFSQDVEGVIQRLVFKIEGLENLPKTKRGSFIVEMNHPPIKDFLEAAFIISSFFPKEIHWFMGENVPRRNLKGLKFLKPMLEKQFKKVDFLIEKIIKTYDFIGVPTKEMGNAYSRRANALRKGIIHLKNSEVVGILPEAEFAKDNGFEPFNEGIGLMIKEAKIKNLRVLPVRVWRAEGKMLHVVIGQSYRPDYHQERKFLTQEAEQALANIPRKV